MRNRRQGRPEAGAGLWVLLSLALLVSVLLGGLVAHRRGSNAIHALSRTTVARMLEEVALSAAAEAACEILGRANDPRGAAGWFDAARPPYGDRVLEDTVDPVTTRALTAEAPFAGLGVEVSTVRVRLAQDDSRCVGPQWLAQGMLHLDVSASSGLRGLQRRVRCCYRFYVDGTMQGTSGSGPIGLGPVRLGRAILVSREG